METCQSFYIALGFKEDCDQLISEFEGSSSTSFQEFSNIWNRMRFSLIFVERSTKSELMEFCEEVLDSAKKFLSSSRTLKEKIGGVYLLYGLYFRMPARGPKIRMTMNGWEIILNLQSELIHHHEYQAVYILNQLIENDAFVYCRCEHERGLENYYAVRDFIKGNSQPIKPHNDHQDLISVLEDLKKQSEHYVHSKNELEQVVGENIPRLFKVENITKIVEEMTNLNDASLTTASTPAKKLMSLRRKTRIDASKPSTSHEDLEDILSLPSSSLPSTSKDHENISHFKMECDGDTESSDDSSDSDF